MTLNQLKVFVLVVRLGSYRAAAHALGVSEPAIAQAIQALRQSLGDQLVVRNGSMLELTAAGQRVVGLASQMVNLAVAAEDAVRQAQGGPALLRVVTTALAGDEVVPALLQAFTERANGVEASLGIVTSDEMAALLAERLADVAIGPRLAGADRPGVVSEPLMRFRLSVVAHPAHRFVTGGAIDPARLAGVQWMVDPSGSDPGTEIGAFLRALNVQPSRIQVFANQRAALAATASDPEGLSIGIESLLRQRQAPLAVLPVKGTPIDSMWHVNTLLADHRSAATSRLLRFVSTPEAMQAMFRADGRVPASKFKPPVHVTLWS